MSLLSALMSLLRTRRAEQVAVCDRCGEETLRRVDVKSSMGSLALCTNCGRATRWTGAAKITGPNETKEPE